ncbi:hypothetical protein SEUCBS140593_001493 [Sporothrix eucalyptigena]|uniref:Gylcosyl hydrolase 115 C-terminal domain-containing protein n=1 Tax=Sporothrix eucalyptigena TaxID=1812306 RepID=A0ABP0AYN1_9PEZI
MGQQRRFNRREGAASAWRPLWLSSCLLLLLNLVSASSIIPGSDLFSFSTSSSDDFYQLADAVAGIAPQIYVDSNDLPGVLRVAGDLATDFGRVLGGTLNATVVKTDWGSLSGGKSTKSAATAGRAAESRPVIVLGTVGVSKILDGIAASGLLSSTLSSIKGKWETYVYQVVENPWPGQDKALVIAGSDLRGTVFGAYGVSEQIGVSPWYWWADVPSAQRTNIAVHRGGNSSSVFGPPSVKFRGIFFNDEAPALTGWGHANFKNSQYGSPFITDFYKHAFELILRLRGNYLWPAMWSSMFYLDDAQNGPTADLYGIFMGTSHHEPMARADKEQDRFLKGSWDWRSNKAGVQAFMREGATRSRNWSTMYTLGMRGSGDAASATLTSASLEEVIHWQQATLVTELGRPLSEIPQQWVMYKEVPGYWQNGMNVSDDVTLLWSDDNRGNIRRVPIANETARRGGSGMYYHFDYVGDPRNYKWINTIQLQKTWEQMTLAYHRGVQNIWLVNVGDLKGLELPTAHIMALAWDVPSFDDATNTGQWLTEWCGRQFGPTAAENASAIMTTYGMLVARRKYEDLSMTPFAFDTTNYDEARRNYAEWEQLAVQAQTLYDDDSRVPAAAKNAFFELVLHPVLAGKTVFEIYTKAALATKYASEHRASTNNLARDVQTAFSTDQALKKRYHTLLGGKWNHFMDQTHLGYNNWQEPGSDSIPKVTTLGSGAATGGILGVAVQGSTGVYPTAASLTLGTVTPYTPVDGQRWIDLFLRNNGTVAYRIVSNASYVTVSNAQQTLTSTSPDLRALISVDWTAAPSGRSAASLTISSDDAGSSAATVLVPLDKTPVPADFHGHVEADGVVSIEAAHHDAVSAANSSYISIPNYGRTHSGVRLPPLTPSQEPGKGPVLVYPFYTFSTASAPSLTVYLSPSENSNPTHPNRYAFSIDGADGNAAGVTVVQPVPLANAGNEPSGWSSAVVAGAYVKTSKLSGSLAPGKHVLRVWLLEPTMVVTKLVLDVGGLKASTLGPLESVQV